MLASPQIGAVVQVWYRRELAQFMPLHGKIGTVKVSSRGKPRNHGIEVDGILYVVPCGNLRTPLRENVVG